MLKFGGFKGYEVINTGLQAGASLWSKAQRIYPFHQELGDKDLAITSQTL